MLDRLSSCSSGCDRWPLVGRDWGVVVLLVVVLSGFVGDLGADYWGLFSVPEGVQVEHSLV